MQLSRSYVVTCGIVTIVLYSINKNSNATLHINQRRSVGKALGR